MTEQLQFLDIFNDHMKIARDRFIEKNEREPTGQELRREHSQLVDYFYE